MNIIKQEAVGRVILNENTPDRSPRFEHYIIPYYQRGYRWGEEHVSALLEDVHNFMNSDEKKYCLQPIVVVPTKDIEDQNAWEVIDGQQRLITLNIIFNYLNRPRYLITFEKRQKSTSFLTELSPESYNDNEPDFHFMSQAYRIIKAWFEDKTKNDVGYIDDFNSTLTKKIELIWYQIEELKSINDDNVVERKKIDIFNRLNIGKIPLTNAELIRALLLSRIKYGFSDREAIMRQAEISSEWHRIESELRQEEFWYFLNNESLLDTSSAIEFIFKIIAKDNAKKYSTYLWFEKKIKADTPEQEKRNAEELWDLTKEYFGKLKHWYQDDELYHHLGFILASEGNSVNTLRNIIDNSKCQKSDFRKWAKEEVKIKLSDVRLDELTYGKGNNDIKRIFLLHNIISALRATSIQKNKFPFNYYKKIEKEGGWSIEHIHAQQSKEIKNSKAIRQWLEDTLEAIKDIKTIDRNEDTVDIEDETDANYDEYKKRIMELLKQESIDEEEFNQFKNSIIRLFDSESIHILDNLTLLSKKHNSALNNAIFPVKRNKILSLEKEGEYIPLATRNVFLKYYTKSDLQPYYWSKVDKEEYYKNIVENLRPYLTLTENE
ncbi:Uncharacterized conserved protein, contains ParB-like and HNH nuclease domains [Nonlabens sp. Hel1_33_55]|uniref:DUF262 domain-containing protein n=1 Tax=Nonlabens sp. Hel1_33_55 TaxID=1336802 RepID=UPI000875A9BC|nr:DUF262 domain-containing protein [Nonlabens sp. Hel1_33_55]SCY40920.1 Uncharacterized conserved protein, contains ParB-like and HNH nuclease domains [Nonlabens sp. Hel1_33_55]